MISAFLSYSSRYQPWVAALHANLERCLRHAGAEAEIFFDRRDNKSGASWVEGLQAGIGRADQLILVMTPEALTSPWVRKELGSFLASRGPQRRIHVVHLIDTPKPPLLSDVQWVDFRGPGKAGYLKALKTVVAGLQGKSQSDASPLPSEITLPEPPKTLPTKLRVELQKRLAQLLGTKFNRRATEQILGLEPNELEDHPTLEVAAAVALTLHTGDDDPLTAARRIVGVLIDEAEQEDLEPLRAKLEKLRPQEAQSGLLGAWLAKVVSDHERLVPYFQQQTELSLLDRVYVQLRLTDRHFDQRAFEAGEPKGRGPGRHEPWRLRDLLTLDPTDEPSVTQRWMILGDPGAGKTTLLRHLAATLAREQPAPWIPIFESLPRWLQEPEWLLDRIARQMKQAGEPAEGMQAVLDRSGQEGKLLLLLDGLDEVPRKRRDDAESLLRRLSARWPETPIVVTSRPIGYRSPGADFRELQLLPFDAEGRREFLARWFGRETGEPDTERAKQAAAALEQDASLRDLASNPLYLTLMALLIEQGTDPDRNRTRLYNQVFNLLLRGKHRQPETPMERPGAVRRMLCHLGYGMTEDNRDSEPLDALEDRLYRPEADGAREDLERVGRWRHRLSVFLKELSESSGILGPHDGPDADWRYWHRTFREALAAEALAERRKKSGGEAKLLEHARQIAEDDLSRWAEPYALLTGHVDDADALVKALIRENRPLGLRALATAQSLSDETLSEVLELSDDWQERRKVYERLPELVGDPVRALALLDQLRQRTRDGNDLFFLERSVAAVAESSADVRRQAEQLRSRFTDHIPAPPEELFQWIETPRDERVELWREIPAGKFLMGSPEGDESAYSDERPQHEVRVLSPFKISAVPVTTAQYAAFDPTHKPETWKGVQPGELPFHPAVNISWYQAVAFCRWLATTIPWATGARLATEEEWEYACRAGTRTLYSSGDAEGDLKKTGWYAGNSEPRTHRVGEKLPNPWGLFDVHGNVWEWTQSEWIEDYTGRVDGIEVNPKAIEPADPADPSGVMRVFRGGGTWDDARFVRSAYRNGGVPVNADGFLGFRVVLPAAPSEP